MFFTYFDDILQNKNVTTKSAFLVFDVHAYYAYNSEYFSNQN